MLEGFQLLKNKLEKYPDETFDNYERDLIKIAVNEKIENIWKELRKSKRRTFVVKEG